jgi:hypothetical protein
VDSLLWGIEMAAGRSRNRFDSISLSGPVTHPEVNKVLFFKGMKNLN